MDNSTFFDNLTCFGLTRQEATIYYSLLTKGKSTGYEISKSTGISRSNAYNALATLVDKGSAYFVEEGNTKKYIPVNIEEFCSNYIRKLELSKVLLLNNMPKEAENHREYITIKGSSQIENKLVNMLNSVESRVYIASSLSNIKYFEKHLIKLVEENKKVVIITDSKYNLKNAHVYVGTDKTNQIGIIIDSETVLTGEFGINSTNTCLYSQQDNFVNLYKNALSNEIKLLNYIKKEFESEE